MSTDSVNTEHISPYFEQFRRDVFAVVPSTAKCVLSVGCGGGKTEAELVKRGIKVVGVEINHEAAAIARRRGLIVLEGDVSEVDIVLVASFTIALFTQMFWSICLGRKKLCAKSEGFWERLE